jgi:hypothetical protein
MGSFPRHTLPHGCRSLGKIDDIDGVDDVTFLQGLAAAGEQAGRKQLVGGRMAASMSENRRMFPRAGTE